MACVRQHPFKKSGPMRADTERSDEFLRSINTVAEEFVIDLQNVNGGLMSTRTFMSIYGHLRPHTYDVLSSRYDERPEILYGTPRNSRLPKIFSSKQKRISGD